MSGSEEDNTDIIKSAKDLNVGSIVPKIYDDALSPAAKELGTGLVTIAKAINLCLKPVSGLIWGYEKIEKHITSKLAKNFECKPVESIIPPPIHIAGPVIEALRFTANQAELRDLYTNLLTTSMDLDIAVNAHPSFVEIIKQLSPDEAKLLKYLSETPGYPVICSSIVSSDESWYKRSYQSVSEDFRQVCVSAQITHIELYLSYLDNFRRLLLLEFLQQVGENRLEEHHSEINDFPVEFKIKNETQEDILVTSLGQQFIDACVKPKNNTKS